MFVHLKFIDKLVLTVLLWVSGLVFSLPLVYLVTYSFGRRGIENYLNVFRLALFPRFLLNSFVIATAVVGFLVLGVALASYAFSKLDIPAKGILFNLFLIGLMIPPSAMIVPMFQTVRVLGLMNTYWSLIGPEIALIAPFALLISRSYFDEIPDALLEAATIDGANTFERFRFIVLPISVPIMTTVAIIVFLRSWNEYLLPLAFIRDRALYTVTLAPGYFIDEYTGDYNSVFAAMVIISIPVIVLFLFGQKYLQRGLTRGGVK